MSTDNATPATRVARSLLSLELNVSGSPAAGGRKAGLRDRTNWDGDSVRAAKKAVPAAAAAAVALASQRQSAAHPPEEANDSSPYAELRANKVRLAVLDDDLHVRSASAPPVREQFRPISVEADDQDLPTEADLEAELQACQAGDAHILQDKAAASEADSASWLFKASRERFRSQSVCERPSGSLARPRPKHLPAQFQQSDAELERKGSGSKRPQRSSPSAAPEEELLLASAESKRRRTDSTDGTEGGLARVLFEPSTADGALGADGFLPNGPKKGAFGQGLTLDDMTVEDVFLGEDGAADDTSEDIGGPRHRPVVGMGMRCSSAPDEAARDDVAGRPPRPARVPTWDETRSGPVARNVPLQRRGTVAGNLSRRNSKRAAAKAEPVLLPEGPDVRGDRMAKCILPTTGTYHPFHKSVRLVTAETVHTLIHGTSGADVAGFKVIDCRFPYEYDGGHIKGAVNLWTMERTVGSLLSESIVDMSEGRRYPIIFHCEFSSVRAPTMCKYLRDLDNEITMGRRQLIYPELYVLLSGYKNFFAEYPADCTPETYLEMADKAFTKECSQHESILSRSREQAKQKKWQQHSTVQTLADLVKVHGMAGLTKARVVRAGSPEPGVVEAPASPKTPCSQMMA